MIIHQRRTEEERVAEADITSKIEFTRICICGENFMERKNSKYEVLISVEG